MQKSKFSNATLCVVIVLTSFLAACSKTRDADALVAEAKQYQQKGDTKSATIQLKNALQKNPDNAEARFLLGVAYTASGDAPSGEKELRKALELHMDPARVIPPLARSLYLQGKAQKLLEETEVISNSSAEILALRGNAYLTLKKNAEAEAALAKALQMQPEFPEALLGQARMAMLEKDDAKALALVNRALVKEPKNTDAWTMQGDILRATDKAEDAKAAYQKVLALFPDNLHAHLALASLAIEAKNYDEATKHIDLVKKLSPSNPMANYMLALMQFRRNNLPAAQEAIQQVLRTAPEHVPSLLLASTVELNQGSLAQAEQHAKWVVDHEPSNLFARKILISTLLKAKQTKRAVDLLEPGLRQAPEDGALMALAGEAYMQSGEYVRATQYFEKAVALQPKNANLLTGLGASRLATGQTERATADLESAAGLDNEKYQADVLLVMADLQSNDYAGAMTNALALEKKQPANPMTHNLKAAAFIGKKDFVNARKSLARALELQPTYFPAAMNLAQLDLQDKNPQAARKRFDAILEKDPKNVQAMIAIANLANNTGAGRQEVLSWLEKARQASPTAIAPRVLLSKYYLETKDYKNAITLAQEALAISPNDAEALDALGSAQLASGDSNQALLAFNKLAIIQPKSVTPQLRVASAQLALNNRTAATESLKKALTIKPDSLEAQLALANVELAGGHLAEATQIAKQVQKQSPQEPVGYLIEGDVLASQKKFPAAVALYEKAYSLGKSGIAAVRLHRAQTATGSNAGADMRLAQYIKDNPDDAAARLYFAEATLKGGKYQTAIEQYKALLQKQPQNVLMLNNIAFAAQKVKDPHALDYAEQAFKLQPENPGVMDTLGWVLVDQGNLARGMELLQKAAAKAPDVPEIHYHLAAGMARSGDKLGAKKQLDQAFATNKSFTEEADARQLQKQL